MVNINIEIPDALHHKVKVAATLKGVTLKEYVTAILRRRAAKDAEARGIAEGDLIRAFNDRGSVILSAQVTERVPSGTVHSYESCADYLPIGTPGESPDTAGCVNILTPKRYITPTSTAMAPNSCLIQVEKWEGEAR